MVCRGFEVVDPKSPTSMSKFTHATTPPPAAQSEIQSQSEVVSRIKNGLRDTARVSDRGDQAGVPWVPRIGATHLSQGPGGVWYMRLAVPARIRAIHPELPAELKRSTKVASKRLALAKAREMCLDFCVKYPSGATASSLVPAPSLAGGMSRTDLCAPSKRFQYDQRNDGRNTQQGCNC